MSSLGDRLRRARESAGYSTRRLAEALTEERSVRTSYGTVAKYERGESQPRADYLLAVCQLCDVRPLWLLSESGPVEWSGEAGADPYTEGMIDAVEEMLEAVRELPAFRRAARLAPESAERWREATATFLDAARRASAEDAGG